jgi:hypothetical protein
MKQQTRGFLMGALAALICVGSAVAVAQPADEAKPDDVAARQADEARKAKMTEAELAWEKLLEANLGKYYLPRYKEAKAQGKATAWDYVKDDPDLPRVLLIGDSISRGYALPVRKELAGVANVHRAPANCGSTWVGRKKLPIWLGDGKWDLITFNFGIHDRNTPADTYTRNLGEIVAALKKTGAQLVWIHSTPLSEGKLGYKRGMMTEKNKIAHAIMKKHDIPVLDLHAVALPLVEKHQYSDGCHFKDEGYAAMAKAIAAELRKTLEKMKPEDAREDAAP